MASRFRDGEDNEIDGDSHFVCRKKVGEGGFDGVTDSDGLMTGMFELFHEGSRLRVLG